MSVAARYVSDRATTATLHDANCPGLTLGTTPVADFRQFADPNNRDQYAQINAAEEALEASGSGSADVRLVGVFIWRPDVEPSGGIIIERVTEVQPVLLEDLYP